MPTWVSAVIVAILVSGFPYLWILRILLQLPRPVALSNRRWPAVVNVLIIAAVTAWVTVFIHGVYYRRGLANPAVLLIEFIITALSYAFGLVLILRQFAGLYPDFFISTGRTGLALRKTAYRNVVNIEEVGRSHGEAVLRIHTNYGLVAPLTLPTRNVPMLYERVKPPL